MRKLRRVVEHAEQHTDLSFSLWHLAIIVVCCWGLALLSPLSCAAMMSAPPDSFGVLE
jgi:hypothetical protein